MKYPDKVFWFDVETSGVNEHENGILQLYGMAELDQEIDESIELLIEPHEDLVIEDEALEVSGITEQDIQEQHQDEKQEFERLVDFFNQYVDPYNRSDKMWIGGYNRDFDVRFLTKFWNRNKGPNDYLGSFLMRNRFLDPYPIVNALTAVGVIDEYKDAKLKTVASELLDLPGDVDWHDAETDIRVTRDLFHELVEEINMAVIESQSPETSTTGPTQEEIPF